MRSPARHDLGINARACLLRYGPGYAVDAGAMPRQTSSYDHDQKVTIR